ncbi:ead/Ea22-like family protein [Zhihengliuella halotolerans]|uniref:ead/Ea22-like family protein n=1 Tax=Zhihengliuella halotolerans TaxID=370736 RepID=UPI000C7F9448|nr:ead/Ea22-like family protein [Zhihengliuella halotolerans]
MSGELDLSDLREIASAATDGPWTHQPYGGQNQNGDFSGGSLFGGDGEYLVSEVADEDGAHIAAFDPPTALALIDRLEAAEAAVARVEALHRKSPLYDVLAGDCEHGDDCEGVEAEGEVLCPEHIAGYTCVECAELASDSADGLPEYPCATRRALESPTDG